ncbi:L7Ae/L30e/S12e/Gadd45 family ribosomal protein [Thermosediminibacter oceani]|uniref:LSU ribosomal protein L7AE n=1 Tax=Thermosediminibacter oceani (strain ATCC BAA-1034 / DSM 16646 / JW/IW-1228P) TaxID=555079 RepID=D9RZK6_THEOJ|nr:ribosomal L7Ae/L30e/S12e/Gadd45 family protein [Thermosediminibacter oceani]ADL06904.1 LSU ribosomal protein L7AE [Thermosediminibacter oceani DSM 16646]
MLNKLKSAPKKTVGTKQTLKAVERDQAAVVFIAQDAEEHVVSGLKELCQQKGVEVVPVATMKELGEACGIDVGAASAAILNQ